MMGAHVLEQARLHGMPKLVIAGTICAYPKFAPVPFHEDDLWNGYPEETNAPYGVAKKMLLVGAQAYREQYGMNAIFLLPVNLYGPRDNFDLETSHVIPALIRKMVEARERGDGRSCSGATARRRASSSTSTTAPRASCWPPSATTAPSPSTSAPATRSRSATWPSSSRELTGYKGEIVWDTSKPNGQPRRRLDMSRAEELFGFGPRTRCARGSSGRSPGTGRREA